MRILDQVKEVVGGTQVFGEPFEKNGTTLIPAFSVSGGGGGGQDAGPDAPSGGGVGGSRLVMGVDPAGASRRPRGGEPGQPPDPAPKPADDVQQGRPMRGVEARVFHLTLDVLEPLPHHVLVGVRIHARPPVTANVLTGVSITDVAPFVVMGTLILDV